MPRKIIIGLIVIIILTIVWVVIWRQQLIGQNGEQLEVPINKVNILVIIFLAVEAVIAGFLIWLHFILKKADEELLKRYYTIKNQSQKLNEAKISLEIRIQARTRELQELAQKLEEQVRERTKELQNKIRELEKFQKITVGRELKMIELKKEIEKLKEELEKYKPT